MVLATMARNCAFPPTTSSCYVCVVCPWQCWQYYLCVVVLKKHPEKWSQGCVSTHRLKALVCKPSSIVARICALPTQFNSQDCCVVTDCTSAQGGVATMVVRIRMAVFGRRVRMPCTILQCIHAVSNVSPLHATFATPPHRTGDSTGAPMSYEINEAHHHTIFVCTQVARRRCPSATRWQAPRVCWPL